MQNQNHLDMEIFGIIVVTAVAVCCISWLAYLLLRKKKDTATVCSVVAGSWCCIDLLLVVAFSALLLSHIDIYRYPSIIYIAQCVFIESFLCGAVIWAYGMYFGLNHDGTERNAIL